MIIVFGGAFILPYNRLISAVLRSDSVPVPLTLEFQAKVTIEMIDSFQEGSIIQVGTHYVEMTIVKSVIQQTGIIKDDERVILGSFIAVLSGCEKIIKPLAKAIHLEQTSIGAAMKASGSKLVIAEDVPLLSYFCPFGQTPTYEIARKCWEEAAIIYSNAEGKIAIKRLSTLMQQDSKLTLDPTSVNWNRNSTQVLHEVPNYITVNPDGSTIEGEIQAGRIASYYPNMDVRRLKNLKTALVTRGIIQRALSLEINAGDVIQVGEDKYYILTAAHRLDTGAMGASTASVSKFWIAQVESL